MKLNIKRERENIYLKQQQQHHQKKRMKWIALQIDREIIFISLLIKLSK
jgi:hypothetical protein